MVGAGSAVRRWVRSQEKKKKKKKRQLLGHLFCFQASSKSQIRLQQLCSEARQRSQHKPALQKALGKQLALTRAQAACGLGDGEPSAKLLSRNVNFNICTELSIRRETHKTQPLTDKQRWLPTETPAAGRAAKPRLSPALQEDVLLGGHLGGWPLRGAGGQQGFSLHMLQCFSVQMFLPKASREGPAIFSWSGKVIRVGAGLWVFVLPKARGVH